MARRRSRPLPYDAYRQRVRRHRRTDVLGAVAGLNARLQRAEFGEEPALGLPNVVQPFSLAGVARTALVAGNDYRDTPVTQRDLVEMCDHYVNVAEPALEREPGLNRLRFVFNHIAYEQFGHQFSAMENVGRTLVLLADHSAGCANAPTPEDWTAALGIPLELFMRLGFAMHVAALSNGGRINRGILTMDHVAPIFTPLAPEEVLGSIDRWFAATPENLRAAGASEEVSGAEKWSLSPLVSKPLVALPDGDYVMPWPRLILDRITPTGLYFIGLEVFGSSFPESLGIMFQDYVGTQLKLLEYAEVRPEIVYGKSKARTVDYFLITPDVVLLVEVKAARPVRATRLGEPLGDEDTAKKVGYAFTQIDRTARLIADGHPELAAIPVDRPLRGLVVTLEPFHLVNTDFYDDVFQRPSVPTTVVSSHEFEGAVAVLHGAADLGVRLLDALTPTDGVVTSLDRASKGLPSAPNPLLDEAWQRFTEPWGSAT